jgi:transposase
MSAPQARTRERALALYDIAQESCATRVAARTGRHPQTVVEWVHASNAQGPDALVYRRTGGRPPFAPGSRPVSARSCAPPSRPRPLHP